MILATAIVITLLIIILAILAFLAVKVESIYERVDGTFDVMKNDLNSISHDVTDGIRMIGKLGKDIEKAHSLSVYYFSDERLAKVLEEALKQYENKSQYQKVKVPDEQQG